MPDTNRLNLNVDTTTVDDTKPIENQDAGITQNEGETERQYIGRLQRANSDLRTAAKPVVDSTTQSTNTQDTKPVVNSNDTLTQADLNLEVTETERQSFDFGSLKAEVLEHGSISQNSLDVLSSSLEKGVSKAQAVQISQVLTSAVQANASATANTVKDILGEISYKDTLRPFAQKHPRYQEWMAGVKGPAFGSVLRDMKTEYLKSINKTDTNVEDNSPTSIDGGAGGGSNADTSGTPESRGYFLSRAEKTAWFRTHGAEYKKSPAKQKQYSTLVAASQAKGLI